MNDASDMGDANDMSGANDMGGVSDMSGANDMRETRAPTFSWRAIWRGALVGFLIVLPLSIVLAIVERALDRSSVRTGIESVLVLVLFVAYAVAGARAGRAEPSAPLTNGILAALGTLALWIPAYLLIVRLRGDDASLKVGTVFGQAVIATFLGMLGSWLAARRRHP